MRHRICTFLNILYIYIWTIIQIRIILPDFPFLDSYAAQSRRFIYGLTAVPGTYLVLSTEVPTICTVLINLSSVYTRTHTLRCAQIINYKANAQCGSSGIMLIMHIN